MNINPTHSIAKMNSVKKIYIYLGCKLFDAIGHLSYEKHIGGSISPE